MKGLFCYCIVLVVLFLALGSGFNAVTQPQVTCPCNYESVPKTTECWVDPFTNGVFEFFSDVTIPPPPPSNVGRACVLMREEAAVAFNFLAVARFEDVDTEEILTCEITTAQGTDFCATDVLVSPLTQEEYEACLCELQAYATALDEVSGISVPPGAPFLCTDPPLDCPVAPEPTDAPTPEPPPAPTDVPTISLWGLLAMAGILGFIGFLAIRRKKAIS